jgi:hypothetical protein
MEAAEFDFRRRFDQMETIGHAISGPSATVGTGQAKVRQGMFGDTDDLGIVVIALTPPTLTLQPVSEELVAIGPPRAIQAEDIGKVKTEEIRLKPEELFGIKAKLKLRTGEQLKLDVISGGLYGATIGAEYPDLVTKMTAACDAIVAWLSNPR